MDDGANLAGVIVHYSEYGFSWSTSKFNIVQNNDVPNNDHYDKQ